MWFDAVRHDVLHTVRGARRRPTFALAVVLTLALGLGANTAMFGVVDRLFFRPPAYLADAARVHRVYLTIRVDEAPFTLTETRTSYTRYRDLVRWSHAFADFAAFQNLSLALGRGEETRVTNIGIVSGSFFRFFDARPALGRFFTMREDSVGAPTPVVVLTDAFWRAHYGGRNVIGDALDIGALSYTIIGVAPRGLAGVDDDHPVAAFIPIAAYAPSAAAEFYQKPSDYYQKYSVQWLTIIARRRFGVTQAAAAADLSQAFRLSYDAERAMTPGLPSREVARPSALIAPIQGGRGPVPSGVSRVALWTSGVAVIVLLVACANVANLFLVRGLDRRREQALRLALGVTRARLLGHVLTEVGLFTALAGALALAAAIVGNRVIHALFLPGSPPAPVVGDARTFAFASLVALFAALLTAVVPALVIGRGRLSELINRGARDVGRRHSRLRATLLLLQGALSVVLLVGAGLFVRSLYNVRTIRLGYDVDPVMYVELEYRGLTMSDTAKQALTRRLLDEVRTVPGVTRAAFALSVPLALTWGQDLYTERGTAVRTQSQFTMQTAAPEFFRAMGTRIIRGRAFADADRVGAPPVMLVSASMAAALWPGRDALGQCLRVSADTMPCATVVGVTEDIRQTGLRNDAEGQYYLPIEQHPSANPVVFVRVDGDATRYAGTVRRRLQRLMPGASYLTVTPMHDIVAPAMRSWQLGATMFVALGVLALVLAVVGLYSVIAYGVVQRTRELGVRRALGAPVRHVLWLVLRDGVQFTVLGLALGGAIAVGAGPWIAPLLFGERPTDPWVYGVVTTVLFLAAIGACVLPALRAARVAPSVALRAD